MSARSRWIILSLALVGLGFATYSAFVHYKILTDPSYQSPCDISTVFNCSQVYLSPYGSVAGVPVALAGVFWFGLVALIAFGSTPGAKSSGLPGGSYLFAIATIGLAVVLYLGYTSWFVLKHLCVLCLGTYASVIGIFIVSGTASTVPVRELPARMFGDAKKALEDPFPLALLGALLLSVGLAVTNFPKEGTVPGADLASPAATDDFAAAWARMPRLDLGIPADGAKVVVVKFNDFQCPACGQTYFWYKPVLEKFEKTNPGAVKMVLKDWPWNAKCNFTLQPGQGHTAACEAAAAVRMARDQGPAKEVEMEEWLYNNQPSMMPDTVKAAAERILGITDFDRQFALKIPDIKKDVADGAALKIGETPTLFINGVRVVGRGLMPASYFELAIQLELDKAAGK
ncbi:MAG TPA: vitamin K epoxide reductase family protein [Vicinamibacterales bacterium]|nr:vitamin K epoxide reductase family protein [Vicinamibacterales bacterium]